MYTMPFFMAISKKETVYMQQPPGFIDASRPHHVCRLSKALYGLKQSPRAWFHTLSSALLEHGFAPSRYDPSLFILSSQGRTLVVLVYVDDILVTGSHNNQIMEFIGLLHSKFALKDLGPIHYFLGIEVVSTRFILIKQRTLVIFFPVLIRLMLTRAPLP